MPNWHKTRWWFTRLVFAAAALATACTTPPFTAAAGISARLDALLPADVLLLGEQHDAPDHQQLERETVQALADRGQLAALALEMADQGTSTTGLTPDTSEDNVRTALRWNDAGWPWAAYGPVVMAAVRAGVPVLGANLPRARMRDAMTNDALDTHLPTAQLQTQRTRIREGHCDLLPDSQIAPMTRIQIARDAAMAQTVMAARQPGKTVLLVAGSGHVDRTLGVPTHLPQNITSKVVLALAGPARTAMNSGADGVWTTPALPPRDYCADLKKQMAR